MDALFLTVFGLISVVVCVSVLVWFFRIAKAESATGRRDPAKLTEEELAFYKVARDLLPPGLSLQLRINAPKDPDFVIIRPPAKAVLAVVRVVPEGANPPSSNSNAPFLALPALSEYTEEDVRERLRHLVEEVDGTG